ncbi:MAG: N-acetylglucosamine-6-phosphate deacetylase [Planctomycetales bacterium]|nr:N-acetylglucosamine-6-phosphate deacetylase [Planctomycetales bacterium]
MPEMSYVDLQVNGFYGVDFNADQGEVHAWEAACQRLMNDGVQAILATVITDSIEAMSARLQRIHSFCQQSSIVRQLIVGVHIEGPFLNPNPGYIGAHPVQHARTASLSDMDRLLDAAQGMTRLVTLAPEQDPDFHVTSGLARQGILVSAGHCNPSLGQLEDAMDAGLRLFTHLGNGCPLQMHRHDNIIQRVLACADRLHIGLIGDGVHVPLFALRNYLKTAGIERCFVVTDAISAAGLGPGTYQLANQTVVVDDDLATWSADRSHLTGSAVTMQRTVQNLVRIGLAPGQIRQLVYETPRRLLEHMNV